MYNNKLKAIVLPVVIALAIVLGMGINSLLDRKEACQPAVTGCYRLSQKC